MKKVKWIFSINSNGGGPPIGYGANMVGSKVKKFQEKIKAELNPAIDVEFISYDTSNNDILNADLIVFNNMDARYINDDIKQKGICIPSNDIYMGNTENIKNIILNFFE